nr:hypothetical protein BaRGS_003910 [Batillaria attramentaria]
MVDVGTDVPLDQATKDALVEQHNNLRAGVDPLAADMAKVIWDDDLALVAAKWARQCIVGHDKVRSVPSLPGIYVGQNGAFGYSTYAGAVMGWYNEVNNFEYGTGSTGGVVGHYTQVVTARTQRIGCGQADCTGYPYTKYYFCNYAYGQYSTTKPYQNSTASCSACPEKCDESGKLCVTCPARDSWVCGPGNQWPPEYCRRFSNVKYSCPYIVWRQDVLQWRHHELPDLSMYLYR